MKFHGLGMLGEELNDPTIVWGAKDGILSLHHNCSTKTDLLKA
jgi:hypothetical protein